MSWLLFVLFVGALIIGIVRSAIASNDEEAFRPRPFIPWAAGALALFLLWLSFVTVDAGTRGIVTRFGEVRRTLEPGAHLVLPFAEHVYPLSVQTLTVKPSEDAASHDLQVVHTQVTLAYHFDPQYVGYLFSQLVDASDNAVENKVINPAILEAIKARTAQYDAQQLISNRQEVRDGIEAFVTERLRPYHIIPETVSITDFHFSKEFDDAIEAKVTAQQRAEKQPTI
jgi:regulator of protease activity HflC (stomatin/prohibitin superfamily)